MKTRFVRLVLSILFGLIATAAGWGYVFIMNGSTPIKWPAGTIPMKIMVDNAVVLQDGTTRAGSIQAAMQAWNAQLGTVQFSWQIAAVGSGADNNGINEIFFSNTAYGQTWDSSTLAVTTDWYNTATSQRVEADIIFNTAFSWSSYRGLLQAPVYDIRRVALHELGHVLGLGHPDLAIPSQSVNAIMNSTTSDIDSLQPDDIAGAQALYGAPNVAPYFSLQPLTETVTAGQSVSFSVTAGGNPSPTYQWQRLPAGGTTWANLSDNTTYSGTATFTLSIPIASPALNGDQYRCIASNSQAGITSTVATLNVNAAVAPILSGLPLSVTFNYGDELEMYPSVSGSDPMTLQWYKDGAAIPNANRLEYFVYMVTTADSGQYTLTATNYAGSTSATILITVNPAVAPSISGFPSSVTYNSGEFLSLTPAVSGTATIAYQWARNGVPITGATSQFYTKANAVPADSGSYTVTATNIAGTASFTVTVTVNPAVAPVFSGLPAMIILAPGDTFSLNPTISGTQPIAYQWLKDGVPLQGAVALAYSNTAVTAADTGQYSISATNIVGTFESPSVALSVMVGAMTKISQAAAGGSHSLFASSDGTLWTVGYNGYGQLGNGTLTSRTHPLPVASAVAEVAAGGAHSLFVKADGTLWATGGNSVGELGDGTVSIIHILPEQISGNVVAIAAGDRNSFFIKSDGTLWAMGEDTYAQLGDGNPSFSVSVPVQVGKDVVAVAPGGSHSVFVQADGTLWGMGDDNSGQIGRGAYPGYSINPTKIATGVVSASAGIQHTLFLKSDGTLWAMGDNSYGQLGDGTTTAHPDPVQVATGVASASAGGNQSLFVKLDGSLWAMGDNSFGQLGDGSTLNRATPVLIASGIASVSTRDEHSFVVKSDGSLWAMGMNQSGQLGDGTSTDRLNPVQIAAGPLTPPAAPVGLTVGYGAMARSLRLSWNPTIGAASYEVWRALTNNPGSAVKLGGMVPISLYYDSTALPGVTYYYWVKAVNSAGTSAFSGTVSITLNSTPSFTLQPASATVVTAGSMMFTTAASGSPAPTYQWQKNGVNIGGATGSSYTIAHVAPADAGSYTVVATNSAGSVTSSAASLTVRLPSTDFNGDGQPDILWENPSTGEHLIWFMNGAAFAGSWADLGSVPTAWQVAAVADFNGDGQPDILWENASTGEHLIWFMNGATYAGWADLGSQPTAWHVVAAADFNGDGQSDILWENPSTGEHLIWFMNGATYAGWADLGSEPTAWQVAAVADFNGDGQPDILWENASTGAHLIWFMNGATYAGWADLGSEPTAWHVVAAADFNGDGQSDILWENPSTGEHLIWFMNGAIFAGWADLGSQPTAWHVAK